MNRRKWISGAVLLGLLSVPRVPDATEPDSAPGLDGLFESLPHATFRWVKKEGVSERAAMHVPVDLDGATGWLQLDTGLDATRLYGELPQKWGWETHDGMYHVPAVRLGDMDLGPAWLRADEDMSGKGEVLGSLGLDLLVGRFVLIDYPSRRLALMSPGEAPRWLLQRTTWTPAELRDAKFFLTVVLGGETVSGLFFDTGASAFEITVDFDTWVALTGRAGAEEATARWTVSSWGKKVTAIGAPARGPLIIGSVRIPEPAVFYLEEQPNLFAHWPFPATGLVGNAPFWDRAVILDLGLRPRFGMVQ